MFFCLREKKIRDLLNFIFTDYSQAGFSFENLIATCTWKYRQSIQKYRSVPAVLFWLRTNLSWGWVTARRRCVQIKSREISSNWTANAFWSIAVVWAANINSSKMTQKESIDSTYRLNCITSYWIQVINGWMIWMLGYIPLSVSAWTYGSFCWSPSHREKS